MIFKIKAIVFWAGFVLCLYGCTEKVTKNKPADSQSETSLKKAFLNDFLIGVAVNDRLTMGGDTLSLKLVEKEFNALSPENVMKWALIHPTPDSFYFEKADNYVALGEREDHFTLGHTLVWHSQIAGYMNAITDSTVMANYLKDHINTVVTRYKGKIDAWDVVNEALNEDGTMRPSIFLHTLGDNYIEMAFELAAKSDPQVDLIYNDYNLWKPEKREGVVRLVKRLQEKGIKNRRYWNAGTLEFDGPFLGGY